MKNSNTKTEVVDRLVLEHDPIMGSLYELQSVEVYVEDNETLEKESNEQ